MKINDLKVRKILTSKGKWTIEVKINNATGSAPEGTSKGKHEAKYIDVEKSIRLINQKIKKLLIGRNFSQFTLDKTLQAIDSTKDFSVIGANTSIAISFAFFNATFKPKKNIFPFPLSNVFGGGAHGGYTDVQEFLIFPFKAKSIKEAIDTNRNFYFSLESKLKKKFSIKRNIEGALVAKIKEDEILTILSELASKNDLKIGLDVAANHLWNGKEYYYKNLGKTLSRDEQIDLIVSWIKDYKLFYVEDPLHEDDFEGFSILKKKVGKKSLICGDDLTVTNLERLEMAMKNKSINSVIIKPNQIGTISQTKRVVDFAKKKNILPVISHRSGETKDVTISRLAIIWNIPLIKIGFSEEDKVKMDELIKIWCNVKNPKMAKL